MCLSFNIAYIFCIGECLAGALWWRDLMNLTQEIGFSTPRLVKASTMDIDKELRDVVGKLDINV